MKSLQRHIMVWCLMMLTGVLAMAQTNTLSIPDVIASPGKTVSVPINLDNSTDVVGVEFAIGVPAGCQINVTNLALTDRASDHTVNIRSLGVTNDECKYKVMIFSPNNAVLAGRTGTILNIPVSVPTSFDNDTEWALNLSDVVIGKIDGSDVCTGFENGTLYVKNAPDLEVSEVSVSTTSFGPGDNITVGWKVNNIGGLPTEGGWKEYIYLDHVNGISTLLGTLHFDGTLTAQGVISRLIELLLPNTLGIDGNAKVRVRLEPNSDAGESVSQLDNNSALCNQSVSVRKDLMISPAKVLVNEEEAPTIRYTLTRSGSTDQQQSFTVNLMKGSRLTVPNQVVIAKDEAQVVFYGKITPNQTFDNDSIVNFIITGNDYNEAMAQIVIVDDTYPELAITTDKKKITEGESLTLTIQAQQAPSKDVTLNLYCDYPKRFKFPSSVILPANSTSVSVEVAAVDNDEAEAAVYPVFMVSADEYEGDEVQFALEDNDIPALVLELTPTEIGEGAGMNAIVGKLIRTTVPDSKITVKLFDDSEGRLLYPETLTLDKNVTSANFTIGIVDNADAEGDKEVELTAAVYIASCSCTTLGTSSGAVTATITIIDDDGPSLAVAPKQAVWAEGTDNQILTIKRNTNPDSELVVSLSSDQDDFFTYDKTVTLPAGQSSVEVLVSVKTNDVNGDSTTAIFTVSAPDYAKGNCWVMVSDQTLPDAVITDVTFAETTVEKGEMVKLSVIVQNQGNYELPEMTPVTLTFAGNENISVSMWTQESVAPGCSTVIQKAITVPSVPGNYKVTATVNPDEKISELLYLNNKYTAGQLTVTPGYTVTMSTDKALYYPDEKVVITGHLTGNKAAYANLEVYLISDVRQTISASSDANGDFMVEWQPYARQAGHFVIGVCTPGEKLNTGYTEIDIYGLRRDSNTPLVNEATLGEGYRGSFRIYNPTGLPMRIKKVKPNHNLPITISFEVEEIEIPAGEYMTFTYTLEASDISYGDNWEEIKFDIITEEDYVYPVTVYYYCVDKKGRLNASINKINTTMAKGATREYPFTIRNIGKGETGKITLSLPSWMKSATPIEMPSMNYGDSAQVILKLTPTEDMQLNVPVTGNIALNCTNGSGLSIPFSIEPVSDVNGTLTIDVCDEFTYYTKEAPHVSGASVTVKHPTTGRIIASGITDENGNFTVTIPEGYYALSVSAPYHDSYSNYILVDPGVENIKIVNLSYQAITVDWKVQETEVEDEYEITTVVNYETNVPVPVVDFSIPSDIGTEDLRDGESLLFYATLVNRGLITAEDVSVELPDNLDEFVFEALDYTEPFNLAPQQSVLVPIKVTKKNGVSTANSPRKASANNSSQCVVQIKTIYFWICGIDRKWHQIGKPLQLKRCVGKNPKTWWGEPTYPGGGGSGPVYGPGGGGYVYGPSSVTPSVVTIQDNNCNPCINQISAALVNCGVSFVPVLGCANGTRKCATEAVTGDYSWRHYVGCGLTAFSCSMDLCTGATLSTVVGAPVAAGCTIAGKIANAIGCLVDLIKPCDFIGISTDSNGPRKIKNVPDFITVFQEKAEIALDEMTAYQNWMLEYFGNNSWDEVYIGDIVELLDEILSDENEYLNYEDFLSLKPENISLTNFISFIDRLNNTTKIANGLTIDTNNYINNDLIDQYIAEIGDAEEKSQELGYNSTYEMMYNAVEDLKEEIEEDNKTVCASISMQFSQSLVLTRQAFRGTLTVTNGNADTAMTDVKLTVEVTDQEGNIATSHEFQINPETLDGFQGDPNFDSGWSLQPHATGKVTVLFIPTKYAAPDTDKVYNFGGYLSYIDPYTGLEVVRDLNPIALTVRPTPNLDLTYFMQRDVYGDDPLTVMVEPMVEAEFSVLINNIGNGEAKDLKITTSQPKIIDNEKGVLIDFEIKSAQLNGGKKNLALGEKIATEFGNIAPHSTAYAQWWFTSTLLGHFVDYDVNVTHVTSYGNPDLSLLNQVTIHELIRSLDVNDGTTKSVGFLVNDIVDANDTPDMLYLSNGDIESVASVATASISKNSDTEYILKVTPEAQGWNYGNIIDPTYGMAQLLSVVRVSDGTAVSMRNFWQTDRTLRDGKDPLYENRIHFADEFDGTATVEYRLTFTAIPDLQLAVVSIGSVPPEGKMATSPISELRVQFNKQIDPTTFTTDDITLYVQGEQKDASLISITNVDNKTFVLDMTQVNPTCENGYHVLTVQTADIVDLEGYNGKDGKQVGWIMYRDGKAAMTIKASPATGGTVTPESGDVSLTSALKITATPAEGYEFSRWLRNGEEMSTHPIVTLYIDGNTEFTAEFKLKTYNLTLDYDAMGGIVSGFGPGIYNHGTEISMKAAATNPEWRFSGWQLNDAPYSIEKSIIFPLTKDTDINAVFTNYNKTITFDWNEGWNWISPMLVEGSMKPSAFVAPILDSVERLVGMNSEMVKDPEYGLIGNLYQLSPLQAYKLELNENASNMVKGLLAVPEETVLTLKKGWNWIGYLPISQFAVNEALANLNPAADDIVKSSEKFSTFANGQWVGTLDTMAPGQGFLYYSNQDVEFSYPAVNVFNMTNGVMASAAMPRNTFSPWSYSSTKYPDNVTMISTIDDLANANMIIGAFVGKECRGVSQIINGRHFLTIHGCAADDMVSFKAYNMASGDVYSIEETISFSADRVGNYEQPYSLHLGELSGVEDIELDLNYEVYPNPVSDKLYLRGNTDSISYIRIFSTSGLEVYASDSYDEFGGINVGHFNSAVYLIEISTENSIIVKRFIKK